MASIFNPLSEVYRPVLGLHVGGDALLSFLRHFLPQESLVIGFRQDEGVAYDLSAFLVTVFVRLRLLPDLSFSLSFARRISRPLLRRGFQSGSLVSILGNLLGPQDYWKRQ